MHNTPVMAWLLLLFAGCLEVSWLVAMKYSQGFTKLWPTAYVFAVGTLSFYLVSVAVKTIPMGTAYVVWTGMGAVGGAVVGMLWFNEPRDAWRLLSMALVVAGILGLKFTARG
jgi:quaternary ammonium compound-resistance protein SugE